MKSLLDELRRGEAVQRYKYDLPALRVCDVLDWDWGWGWDLRAGESALPDSGYAFLNCREI